MNILEALLTTAESIKLWADAKIPTKTSQLNNDSNFVTLNDVAVPNYNLVKAANSGDYAAVYNLTKDGAIVGASINIPKDMVVKRGSVVGDEIVLVLNDEEATEIKIPVSSLVEYVTSGSEAGDMVVIAIDETTHKVTATITDGTITAAKFTTELQTAIDKAHSHENAEVLAGIDADKIAAWDKTSNGGIYVGTGDMPDGYNVQIDPTGDAIEIPTKTSELENDNNFIAASDINFVTPQMFGAVADGETDDTNAVQTALNQGGVIYFPSGVYKVTRQLTTTKPCKIMMFKQYPSRYWRSGATSGRYDYPIRIEEGKWDYQTEKGWDFGARIECYPSEGERYGFLIGDGCEVDGLFMRAMNGFSGVLLAYDDAHQYGTDNLGDPITYSSYPSSARFKHIRLDCDRHNNETAIPESMFDFNPHGKYFYIFDDIVIGQQNEFATYGFRSVIDEEATWANSIRISNLCLTGLFDYPLYIVEENTNHSLTNWVFEGLVIQTYRYDYGTFEPTLEGHKAVITLKRLNYCLFSGCYIWDLFAAKYVKLFDCENINNISCVGCSEEFYYGTKKLVGDAGEDGIETVLKDRLQEVADDANVKTLTMTTTTLEDGSNRIELIDNHGNAVSTDIPAVSLSDKQLSTGINNWMADNANPVELVGKNKFNVYSEDVLLGYLISSGRPVVNDYSKIYAVSHFIPVKYNDTIRISTDGVLVNWSYINMYDDNYGHIRRVEYTEEAVIKPGWIFTVDEPNVAYIRFVINCGQNLGEGEELTIEHVVNRKLCLTINNANVSYEPYESRMVGGLTQYFLLQSPNGTRYTLSVTDDGTIVGEPITS